MKRWDGVKSMKIYIIYKDQFEWISAYWCMLVQVGSELTYYINKVKIFWDKVVLNMQCTRKS